LTIAKKFLVTKKMMAMELLVEQASACALPGSLWVETMFVEWGREAMLFLWNIWFSDDVGNLHISGEGLGIMSVVSVRVRESSGCQRRRRHPPQAAE
jgi:hypothetical protein